MTQSTLEMAKERFSFTVFLSACLHGILILGVGFAYLGENSETPALEITLAQYRSTTEPDDADFLAQENQVGSGVLEEAATPSTPFASDFNADVINEVSPPVEQTVPTPTGVGQTPEPAKMEDIAVVSAPDAERPNDSPPETAGVERDSLATENLSGADLSLAIASLQAQLDLQRQAYAMRPRKYTISSASTRFSEDAEYLDGWRRRIEAVGNLNYPEEARRHRIYGSLRMVVSLSPDGRVRNIKILQSSGHPILDQAAMQIVGLAAPFAPFPESLRGKADVLEIVRTWRFHEGNAFTSY